MFCTLKSSLYPTLLLHSSLYPHAFANPLLLHSSTLHHPPLIFASLFLLLHLDASRRLHFTDAKSELSPRLGKPLLDNVPFFPIFRLIHEIGVTKCPNHSLPSPALPCRVISLIVSHRFFHGNLPSSHRCHLGSSHRHHVASSLSRWERSKITYLYINVI